MLLSFISLQAFADMECASLGDAFYAPEAAVVSKRLEGKISIKSKKNSVKVSYDAHAAITYVETRYSSYDQYGNGYNRWGNNTESRGFSNRFNAHFISEDITTKEESYIRITNVNGGCNFTCPGDDLGYDVTLVKVGNQNVSLEMFFVPSRNIKLTRKEIIEKLNGLSPEQTLKFEDCTAQ